VGNAAGMPTDVAVPRFSRHAVRGLYSVAHLFPKSQRCGIYILEFTNGDRYVGQAIDVVRRFGNHRHNLGDIAFVEFSACRRTQLNDLEVRMIHQQRGRGHRLRNIVHGIGPVGESDLDPLVTPSEQFTWLNDPDTILDDEGVRVDDPEQRASRRRQYEHLREQPMFPMVAQILHGYVPACLPKPAETERTFWAVSALPEPPRD
jgi:predicted GIY-YIG superfamily endonuclease